MPFREHIELLQLFLIHRNIIVERIEGLLNAQRKPISYLQDGPLLTRHFEDCFSKLPGVSNDQSRLRTQLEEAHWASGFRPRKSPGMYNELVDSAEMMIRGFYLWQMTHWPGHSGRVRYAHTLFNLHLIRWLTLLTMRLWDDGEIKERLAQIQGVLDHLWKSSPPDQPVFLRDARWLIPFAQSPTTDELHGYFDVAENIAEALSEEDRIEVFKASVRLAGGHLRSQLRHVGTMNGVPFHDHSVVLSTRTSNALDLALLTQGLVPLFDAYENALHRDNGKRLELADAICQAISPDPELFVNRLDLLGPYSMIEHLFITNRDGHAVYTPMGQRHVRLIQQYDERIRRLSKPLYEDCRRFRPVDGAYSPYGVLFGYSYNLIEHIALKSLRPDATTPFSIEDVFVAGEADKLAWVNGWRKLPHIKPEVAKMFDYPQRFAEDMFGRIEHALAKAASDSDDKADIKTGRILIQSGNSDLPLRYVRSSETQDEAQLLHSRFEGEFLVSYKTSSGWVAVSKDMLTDVIGTGADANIAGLPVEAAEVLKLMCLNLVGPLSDQLDKPPGFIRRQS